VKTISKLAAAVVVALVVIGVWAASCGDRGCDPKSSVACFR